MLFHTNTTALKIFGKKILNRICCRMQIGYYIPILSKLISDVDVDHHLKFQWQPKLRNIILVIEKQVLKAEIIKSKRRR